MRKLELPCEIGDLVYEVFFDEELKRAVLVPPHKVEDVSVYSILIGGDWTSRSEIGKTVFFEPEEAVKACAEMNATKGVSIAIGDHIYEVFFDRELNFGPVVFARDVEDVSAYSIFIDGRWVSRSLIGETVFFEPEEAMGACLKLSHEIGSINIFDGKKACVGLISLSDLPIRQCKECVHHKACMRLIDTVHEELQPCECFQSVETHAKENDDASDFD